MHELSPRQPKKGRFSASSSNSGTNCEDAIEGQFRSKKRLRLSYSSSIDNKSTSTQLSTRLRASYGGEKTSALADAMRNEDFNDRAREFKECRFGGSNYGVYSKSRMRQKRDRAKIIQKKRMAFGVDSLQKLASVKKLASVTMRVRAPIQGESSQGNSSALGMNID